jgi:hypothetical protein
MWEKRVRAGGLFFYGLQPVEIELIFPNGNMSRAKQKTTRYAGESQIVIQLRSPLSIIEVSKPLFEESGAR